MKKLLFILSLSMITLTALATGGEKDNASISGKVVDAETGDELTGVRVMIEGTDLVTYTDRYGYFSFETLPKGDHEIHFSFISFEELSLPVSQLSKDSSSEPSIKLASR